MFHVTIYLSIEWYLLTTRRITSGSDKRTSHSNGNTSSIICVQWKNENQNWCDAQWKLVGNECVNSITNLILVNLWSMHMYIDGIKRTCDLSNLSSVRSMHCNTLTTILRSLWFFSNTNLIFGKTILRIDISSNDSYTLATATSAALCTRRNGKKLCWFTKTTRCAELW